MIAVLMSCLFCNPCALAELHTKTVFGHFRAFALIVSEHPYCVHKFTGHVMHEVAK